ncbi:MAG TPA: RHS repeat domain-containing protein [Chitinophagaceae bacterium]|nr:RHS repeat domain-containing protein [Chitinophagaceae bacterium]
MKSTLLIFLSLCSITLQAQYYYRDIIGTEKTNRQMKTYLNNKVQKVSSIGMDPSGRPNTEFSELQEVKENGLGLKVTTRNTGSLNIFYNRFDPSGRLISIEDSSSDIQSTTTYIYDAMGRISIVRNSIRDTANDFTQTESHNWIYGANGKPSGMWRIINNTDSLEIRFVPDSSGNVGDEKTMKHGLETGVIYYYYDNRNRLTDIVRYNTKAKKLLPDIMFEYDDQDHVIQEITTTSSLNLNYLIWRYAFNDKGLKTKEALFNNDKEMTGKIEYTYTFGQ